MLIADSRKIHIFQYFEEKIKSFCTIMTKHFILKNEEALVGNGLFSSRDSGEFCLDFPKFMFNGKCVAFFVILWVL